MEIKAKVFFCVPAGEAVKALLGSLTMLSRRELTKEKCLKGLMDLPVDVVYEAFLAPKVLSGILKGIKNIPKIKKAVQGIIKVVKEGKATRQVAGKVVKGVGKGSHKIVGSGSVLRKVEFFGGLQHAKTKHFFGKGVYSLKTLDPKVNPDKWTHHFIELAQRGNGTVKNIPTGQIMEVKGMMPKADGSGILNIGVRLFKASGSNTWKLNTILT